MSWREKTVAKILLLVARMLADDPVVAKQIERLATEISVASPREKLQEERDGRLPA